MRSLGSCGLLLPDLGLHRVPWQHQFLNHGVCWTLWVKAVFLKEKKRNISRNEDLSSGENNALYSVRTGEQGRAVMPLVTTENKGCCIETKNQDNETFWKWARNSLPGIATAAPRYPWMNSWAWRPEPGIARQ